MTRDARDGAAPAELFALLWETLADVLGTAAAAMLLRRSITRAAARATGPGPVIVARNGLDYTYRLPDAWQRPGDSEALAGLRLVAAELRGLLVELTGPVVVTRLAQLAPLREGGIDFGEEA